MSDWKEAFKHLSFEDKARAIAGVLTLVFIIAAIALGGEQFFARKLGGHQVIELKAEERLQTIAWKEGDLWLLTYKDASIEPRTYNFNEDSLLGVLEGSVTIIEK